MTSELTPEERVRRAVNEGCGAKLTESQCRAVASALGLDAEITPEDVAAEPMLQFFGWSHLPPHLQPRSALFGRMALELVKTTPRNPERTVALRKLLESKDAGVRAHLPPPQPLTPPSGPPETVGVPFDFRTSAVEVKQ